MQTSHRRMPAWSTAFWILACCALVGAIVSMGRHSVQAQTATPTSTPTTRPSPTPTPNTAIGGVSLFSTVSIPLQPVIQPVANLCRDLVIESPEDEWQISHSSISLGTLSNEVPAFDILQRTLIVQKCTGEILPTIPRVREFTLEPVLPEIIDLPQVARPSIIEPQVRSPIITERAIDPRLLQPEGSRAEAIVPEVEVLPQVDVPVEAVDPILRGIELAPIDVPLDFPEWQPAPQESITIEGPEGFFAELEPGIQPNTWSFQFPEDSPSGVYTVIIRSGGQTIEKTIPVLRQERIVLRNAQTGELVANFVSPQEIEIEYIDFLPDQPVLVALYRAIPPNPESDAQTETLPFSSSIPQTLAPVTSWTLPSAAGASHSLASRVDFPEEGIVSGQYVVLVCYVELCDPAPVVDMTFAQEVREVRWPDLFHAAFAIESEPLAISALVAQTMQMQFADTEQWLSGTPVSERLAIRVQARDENVGQEDGAGVDHVDFLLFDASGILVHVQRENTPAYCLFGGEAPCQPWQFAANEYQWPGGAPIRSGWHTVRAVVSGESGGSMVREASFLIQLSPLVANIIQTGPNGAQTLVTDALVFRAEAYDPAVGLADGAGIAYVDLELLGPDGRLIGSRREQAAPYCLFSNPTNATVCNLWSFAQYNQQWPDGSPIVDGTYTLRATAVGAGGREATVEQTIVIGP